MNFVDRLSQGRPRRSFSTGHPRTSPRYSTAVNVRDGTQSFTPSTPEAQKMGPRLLAGDRGGSARVSIENDAEPACDSGRQIP